MEKSEAISLRSVRIFLLLCFLTGIGALTATFWSPSEAGNSLWLGYSGQRILLGAGLVALLAVNLILLIIVHRNQEKSFRVLADLNHFFRQSGKLPGALIALSAFLLLGFWCFVFSWLFIPANLRPAILWAIIALALALIFLAGSYWKTIRSCSAFWMERWRLFPRLSDLTKKQRNVLLTLCALSLLYLLILLPSNLNGTRNMEAFRKYGGDEYVIYPILMDVMRPGETFSATLYHRFIYEDYHYGYPFYAWSMIVLKPVQGILGDDFENAVWINLPLLRIFVSVLPVVLAAMVLTYLFTRFRGCLISSAVFIFLLTAPGTLQNNQGFWHPDGLNLLFIALMIYFLQRDRQRFGRNYYLSALFCGLAAATRLYGFFFAPAVAAYLLAALVQKRISFPIAVKKGVLFVLVMALAIAFSSPFLFRADARANMTAILSEKSSEMAEGYAGDYDPRNDYRPGWDAWYPAFEDHYVMMYCFFFLIFSLAAGSFYGDNRLTHQVTFLWVAAITGYLIFFVAVKSTQYVLPALLPLMASIFSLPILLQDRMNTNKRISRQMVRIVWIAVIAVFLSQLIINLIKIAPRFGL